jgi:phosphate transport system substrate-binding protein
MKLKKIPVIILVVMMLMGIVTGCAKPGDANPQGVSGITINGSTSVQPLAEELAQAFKGKNPDVTIDIQGGGSGVGIKSTLDGVVDIGMSSRELKEEEKSLKEFRLAVDGIAVIINPANEVSNLTMEEIRKIYAGEISDWSEVGGKNGKITVVTREEGSGTRGAFIELTGLEAKEGDKKVDKTITTAITQGSTGAVMTTVAGDPNAIGYASYGSAKDKTDIKSISVDGQACTEENLNSGSYKISRPFLMLTKEEPIGLSKDFLDFVLGSEGQEIVGEHGYLKTTK